MDKPLLFLLVSGFLYVCNMKKLYVLVVLMSVIGSVSPNKISIEMDPRRIVPGETAQYRAKWGILTIGSASSYIDRKVYRYGSHICYKIDLSGRTNGLASLFYLRDSWTTYVDNQNFNSHKFIRSIREANYKLDETVYFDYRKNHATVMRLDQNTQKYFQKATYDLPAGIRDVAAGFMLLRIVDFSKFQTGQRINISGFYGAKGYSMDVVIGGREYIKTDRGKILCYKIKPVVPKNKVFDGLDAVDVWLSADAKQTIILAKAKLVLGELVLEKTDYFD